MNEEILKEAVNFGATLGNHWEKYTDGGRSFFSIQTLCTM